MTFIHHSCIIYYTLIADFENTFFRGSAAPRIRTHSMHKKTPDPEAIANGPLSGIRVVEFGVFHAGPGAGTMNGWKFFKKTD